MSRPIKNMAILARTATNLTFRRELSVFWPTKVLCTTTSTKCQIESDVLASIYEFIESGKMDNLIFSLMVAKNSNYSFKNIKSLEVCDRPNQFSAKMFITFLEKSQIKITFKMHIHTEKSYISRKITSSKVEDIHNELCDQIRSDIQKLERIYSEANTL